MRAYRIRRDPRDAHGMLRLLVALCVPLGCAPQPQPRTITPEASGYVIAGPRGAVALGLLTGDTLREVAAEVVPPELRAAAAPFANVDGFDASCSRYFVAAQRYLVLLNRFCNVGYVSVFDAHIVVLVRDLALAPTRYVWRTDQDFVGPFPVYR